MYAYEMDVLEPVELYDRVHAEVQKALGGPPEGCLLHLVTRIEGGFRVIDVWSSREAAERFEREVMSRAVETVMGAEAARLGPPSRQEFEVHHMETATGLVAA